MSKIFAVEKERATNLYRGKVIENGRVIFAYPILEDSRHKAIERLKSEYAYSLALQGKPTLNCCM